MVAGKTHGRARYEIVLIGGVCASVFLNRSGQPDSADVARFSRATPPETRMVMPPSLLNWPRSLHNCRVVSTPRPRELAWRESFPVPVKVRCRTRRGPSSRFGSNSVTRKGTSGPSIIGVSEVRRGEGESDTMRGRGARRAQEVEKFPGIRRPR